MSKRVIHINVTANWGSTGKICEYICSLAEKNGWESYIAYGRQINTCQTKTIKVGTKLDVYRHLIFTRLFDRHGLSSEVATKKLIAQLKAVNPDVIHLHNIHGYFLNYPILFEYLKMYNIPVVWTLHDCWPFTGHCAHFDDVDCCKWMDGCYDCPQIDTYPSSLFIDRCKENWEKKRDVFSTYSNIVFAPVSNWIDGYLKRSFFKNYSSQVIHNGIDLNIFAPQAGAKRIVSERYNIPLSMRIILGVASRWDKRKGLDDFIKLSQLLDSTDYRIILVGVNNSQMKNLPPNIFGIEHINSQPELATLYSAADVFVNPTYSDTYPTTNLESIACGTPVLTYNTGGSPESITDVTGKVVHQGDVGELKNGIISFCNTKISISLSEKCRQYAVNHFDNTKCFSKYIELYASLL